MTRLQINGRSVLEQRMAGPRLELVPNEEKSVGGLDGENLIIQGDNLEALRALLPLYAGRVKCIYIDPPYNTGQVFEYDDDMTSDTWQAEDYGYPRFDGYRRKVTETLTKDNITWGRVRLRSKRRKRPLPEYFCWLASRYNHTWCIWPNRAGWNLWLWDDEGWDPMSMLLGAADEIAAVMKSHEFTSAWAADKRAQYE